MSMIGYIGDSWHLITFKEHPNPTPAIEFRVLAVAPCGATMGHIPLLGAMIEPTCPACLKAFRAQDPKRWSPRRDEPGKGFKGGA